MSGSSSCPVAVVIPAFNAAAFVDRAIESALAQTLPPAEIVVVDDGSTDRTAEVAEAYSPRVRVIRQANGGPGAARNHGIRATSAEWIALLDADDRWHPKKLERQWPLTADPAVGIVQSKGPMEPWPWPADPTISPFEALWIHNRLRTSTVLIRRAALDAVGTFDEDRRLIGIEDYNLWLRMARAGWKFAVLHDLLIEYSPNEQSLTRQVERFASAELYHARKFAEQVGLSDDQLAWKLNDVMKFWGYHLFHQRRWPTARVYLRGALSGKFEVGVLARLAATYFPIRGSSRA